MSSATLAAERVADRGRCPTGPRRRQRYAAAGASGVLLGLSYPPFHLGLLALVALVPLCWAWRDATPRQGAALGFVGGVVFFAIVLAWVRYFGAVAVFPLVAVMAASWAGVGAVVAALHGGGFRSPWLTAAAWVAAETVIGRWPLGGFPWGEVGLSLHNWAPARALASWGGVSLISFFVVAGNGLLLDTLIAARTRAAGAGRRAVAGLAFVVLAIGVLVAARFDPTPTGHLRFALIQGNDKNRDLTTEELASRYLPSSHFRLASTLRGPLDLVVFPESSMDADPERDAWLGDRLKAIGREHHSAVLANALVRDDQGRTFNTNRLYRPDGRLVGSYSKQHLVPFGEYVPFRSSLGFIDELKQVPIDFTPGADTAVFDVKGRPIGTVICFESSFSPLVRDFVRDGAEAIVVTTNNRSYRRSGNSAQHLAMSQMRAAETARPVLHASISGITGVIDASGRLHRSTKLFERTVVTGEITTTTGETPYVRFGDWVPGAAILALFVVGGFGVIRTRKSPASPAKHPAP